MGAENILPRITINNPNQLIQVRNEKSGELVQVYRIKGATIQPKLHESGIFTVIIGEGEEIKRINKYKKVEHED